MSNRQWTVARLCAVNLRSAWMTTLTIVMVVTVPSIIQIVQAGPDEYFANSYLLSSGNAWYPLLVVAPAIVATRHIAKVMHLNAAKEVFLGGAVILYALLALAVSATNLGFYHVLDRSWAQTFQVVNVADVVGWTNHGVLVAFVQQAVFLLLVGIAVHCLVSLHGSWTGWLIDLALLALISASFVVEPLISVRGWIVELLVVHPVAIVQIVSCVIAAMALYAISLTTLRRQEL